MRSFPNANRAVNYLALTMSTYGNAATQVSDHHVALCIGNTHLSGSHSGCSLLIQGMKSLVPESFSLVRKPG